MFENIEFKGLDAIKYSNDFIELIIIPDYGGKLASIKSKLSNREFLFQSKEDKLKIPSYASSFSDYDSSGFDEVFPTIDACPYPDGLNKNKLVPDHGEVWAMPWNFKIEENTIKLWVESKNFSYILEKQIKLEGNCVNFTYTLKNLSKNDNFKFIWTPHALLNGNESTKIVIPKYLDTIISVEHSSQHLGSWGSIHSYPLTKSLKTNKLIDLSRLEDKSANNCEKFYFLNKLKENDYCGVDYTDTKEKLLYKYDVDKVPYLGVWKTHGAYRGDYNFALEPCTGVYDDLYLASKIKKVPIIEAGASYNWDFTMEIINY